MVEAQRGRGGDESERGGAPGRRSFQRSSNPTGAYTSDRTLNKRPQRLNAYHRYPRRSAAPSAPFLPSDFLSRASLACEDGG